MDIFIDDKPFACPESDLCALIAAVRRQVEPEGLIVVEIRVDGRPLDDEDLSRPSAAPLQAREVQFLTAIPGQIVGEALLSASLMLQDVRETQRAAADLLTADQPAKALDHVRTTLNVWQQAQQSVQQSAALLRIDLNDVRVNDQPITAVINDLVEKLSTIREQLTSNDWVGLSDSIGYDLDIAAQQWVELLQVLRRRIMSE